MSLFRETMITCPACKERFNFDESDSVNGDRRPDLRDAIIDGSFQVVPCPSCSETIRMEPQFNYLDMGNSLWIAAFPARMMPDFLELEDTATEVFDDAYGANAVPMARTIGESLDVRLIFGWPAIREKLVLRLAGLDDVVVEMLKLDLLRRLPEAALGAGIELRVLGVDDEALNFGFMTIDSEEVKQEFAARRELYDAIANNPDGWAPVRAQLTEGPFVDIQKLYLGQGRAAAQ